EIAQMMLNLGEVDAVVVGAVDLYCSLENLFVRNRYLSQIRSDTPDLALGMDQKGWVPGEGAGAIVLKRASDDTKEYARIEGVGLRYNQEPSDFVDNYSKLFSELKMESDQIDYVELYGSSNDEERSLEIEGLNNTFKPTGKENPCAIGCVKNNFGEMGVASAIASIIKTAIALNNRFLPGTPEWQGPISPEKWSDDLFYVPNQSRTWYDKADNQSRMAAINNLGNDQTIGHCILSEGAKRKRLDFTRSEYQQTQLFCLSGIDEKVLIQKLNELLKSLSEPKEIREIARKLFY
ncbi:MAG: hypothetical protein GY786_16280, partial [Proteobacteria bacterium]|nr:hypothetical protein [Pseudomonadota bacterium]